jgi:hypothetical protein
MINQDQKFKYNDEGVDKLINELISTDDSLKAYYQERFKEDYSDGNSTRLFYLDIAHISRYIVDCVKKGQTDFFDRLFEKVEYIILDCDKDVENLMVVGLFEGIQNVGGQEINYYIGFNKWLKPTSKIKWDDLIDSWEGTDWRKRK